MLFVAIAELLSLVYFMWCFVFALGEDMSL